MAACALLLLLAPAAQVAGPAVRREVCGCDGGRSAAVGERARRRPPSCRALLLAHAPQLCACVCSSRVRLVLALFAGPCYDACMLSLCRWRVITLIVQADVALLDRAKHCLIGTGQYSDLALAPTGNANAPNCQHNSPSYGREEAAPCHHWCHAGLVTANERAGSSAFSFLAASGFAWR